MERGGKGAWNCMEIMEMETSSNLFTYYFLKNELFYRYYIFFRHYVCGCVCVKYILHDYWLFWCRKVSLSWIQNVLQRKYSHSYSQLHILFLYLCARLTAELLVEVFFYKFKKIMPMINSISILVGINLIVIEKAQHSRFTYNSTQAHMHAHSKLWWIKHSALRHLHSHIPY